MQTAERAQAALRGVVQAGRAEGAMRFFKVYDGGYSENDSFLGCTVPATRMVAKQYYDMPLLELDKLIASKWHEDRLLALIILVRQYKHGSEAEQKAIYEFYLAHTTRVNNWDLVDMSAEFIVGPYLEHRPEKMEVLRRLAGSDDLWERRIAMLATFDYIKKGSADDALAIADILLYDSHDLIQKAVGWMLREIGKRVDRAPLLQFLDRHAATMPRTTLRYAIEHLSSEQKAYYMGLKKGRT
jgi:3-methyladenine DNA glycosylase AlkD